MWCQSHPRRIALRVIRGSNAQDVFSILFLLLSMHELRQQLASATNEDGSRVAYMATPKYYPEDSGNEAGSHRSRI